MTVRSEVISIFALIISIGAVATTYNESEKARIESMRPRLKIENGLVDNGAVRIYGESYSFILTTTVTNMSTIAARNVRGEARLFRSNNPRFAEKIGRKLLCGNPIANIENSMYSGGIGRVSFNIDTSLYDYINNPGKYSNYNGVNYENGSPSYYVIECVTYSTDENQKIFSDIFTYSLTPICKDGGCSMSYEHSSETPLTNVSLTEIN